MQHFSSIDGTANLHCHARQAVETRLLATTYNKSGGGGAGCRSDLHHAVNAVILARRTLYLYRTSSPLLETRFGCLTF